MKTKSFKVLVEIVFLDLKHNTRCSATLFSNGLYDIDHYMYEAIVKLGLQSEPNDKFEIISFKVFNLSI